MLTVVAPSSTAIAHTSAVNSASARVASMGENSTSWQYCRAWATAARAWPLTSSRVVWSWWRMCMSDVEMNVWMRGRGASLTAFQAASMSLTWVRARPATIGPSTSRAIAWTASKSPGLVIGKPASTTSTPRRASCWAISSFSAVFSEMPGDCSPSRSVVSKLSTRLGSMLGSPSSVLLRAVFAATRPPRAIPPEGGGEEGEGQAGGPLGRRLPSRRVPKPILLLIVAAALLIGAAPATADPLKLGLIVSQNGQAANIGVAQVQGAQLEAERLGGVELAVRDDASTPDGAKAAMTDLLDQGATTILGPTLSTAALQADPIAQGRGVPVIAISNT